MSILCYHEVDPDWQSTLAVDPADFDAHCRWLATRTVLEQTLKAFREGSAPPADAQCGRDVLEVIAASYHSAAVGRRVEIDSAEVRDLAGVAMGA